MNKRNAADDDNNDNEIFMIAVGNWVTGAAQSEVKAEKVQGMKPCVSG